MLRKFTVFLLFLGLIVMIVGVVLSEGDFSELTSTVKTQFMLDYEYKTVTGDGPINKVQIDLTDNNVYFQYSEDETYFIDYQTAEEDAINVTVADGKIVMKQVIYKWYKWFRFKYKTDEQRRVNIHLPASFAGDINVDITSGSVDFKNFTANDISIFATSGNINLANATINDLDIDITSGVAVLSSIEANKLKIDHTSGKVTLKNINANNLKMDATSGNIIIKDTEIATVYINLTTGNINIESIKTDSITTDITSGNTIINLIGDVNDYKAILEVTTGKIIYNGNKQKNATINKDGTKLIDAYSTSGNININFIEE